MRRFGHYFDKNEKKKQNFAISEMFCVRIHLLFCKKSTLFFLLIFVFYHNKKVNDSNIISQNKILLIFFKPHLQMILSPLI